MIHLCLMHIPDGFLDFKTAAMGFGCAAAGLYACRKFLPFEEANQTKRIARMGLGAAFVFAAQMVNFPIVAGSSGHLLGGTLMAILLGPRSAVTIMTAVVLTQCLLFADGGITALGANLFNMALAAPLGGYLVWAFLQRFGIVSSHTKLSLLAAALAGWCGTMFAAVACACQLAASDMAPWNVVVPVMAAVHAVIGLIEGAATALLLRSIDRRKHMESYIKIDASAPSGRFLPVVLVVGCGLALFAAPWACTRPDGLEYTAESLGFLNRVKSIFSGIWPDYKIAFLGEVCGTYVAGLIGALFASIVAVISVWPAFRHTAKCTDDPK